MERLDQVRAALATVRVPVFLARATNSRGGNRVVLHTTDGASVALLRKQAEAAFRAKAISVDCKIVVHTPAALARKKSLEAFSTAFGVGDILFDPTRAIARAASITECAAALRAALGPRVRGILIDAARRALFVILDRRRFSHVAATMLDERVEAMGVVAGTINAWRASQPDSVAVAVRIGFELPAGVALIPVDRRSERLVGSRFFDRLRKPGIAATLASLVGVGAAAQAVAADATLGSQPGVLSQTEPAVAAPNLGLIAGGGLLNGNGFDNEGWGAVGLKGTVPLGEHFGGQVDAAVGADSYAGIGGHLFWRDPSRGMIGAVASYETMDGNTLSRFAVEGEVYKGDFTLRGEIGGQSGTTSNGAFGSLDLTFYATPNLALSAGGEFGTNSLARASIEWQPAINSLPGLSLFADGQVGSGDSRILAGVKYYFGTHGASLKDRDRRFDPTFSLFNTQNLRSPGYSGSGYSHTT